MAWSMHKEGIEDVFLAYEASTRGLFGQLKRSRALSDRAVESAKRAGESETAASYEAEAALREALYGNFVEGRRRANSALALSNGSITQFAAALALALSGDEVRAESLTDDLERRYPEGTLVKFNYLPAVRAEIAIVKNEPSKAVESLKTTAGNELGVSSTTGFVPALYTAYMCGNAYLTAHEGDEASAEFQKIIDHSGLVLNEAIGALAHMQIGRAYAMSGDSTRAKAAYKDFLTLWKDADPDIPVLKQAKAEYAKLQ